MKSKEIDVFRSEKTDFAEMAGRNGGKQSARIIFQKSVARACIYEKKVVILRGILRSMPFREHLQPKTIT